MAFIRNKNEERTGYQSGGFPSASVDNHCDFVMVYRLDETMLERIKMYREKGYVIHLMTGISWGRYQDYLYGEYDGKDHWDEAQKDRNGNLIIHGKDVPYMVPTVEFANYLCQKMKAAVDAGVEAIHVEEPEFWDRGGYSDAFKREYEIYYREKWTPPHESLDSMYKTAKLKAYLYTRTIDTVSSFIKEYSYRKYGKAVRFYVPTHSLLNYTQWHIVSPEGRLADIPGVDGCIAQVWTGTSREKNWFNGEFKERTFETAYLEYGVMQELVKGTGRKMWFLHDPIEDNPIFDWTDYRVNYLKTVTASLLHPKVNSFEICPWPNRVFEDKYPKNSPDAEPIPEEYATVLNNMFNTLGTFEEESKGDIKIGILMGDCQLYQRNYPDCEFGESQTVEVGTVLKDSDELLDNFKNRLFREEQTDKNLFLKYVSSNAFPSFYGLALPLLKYGVAVRPVLLDNARRYNGYLDDYNVLIMSYEFMKPDYPDINASIAQWVRSGGTLIYVGDGYDPYHKVNSWWTGKFPSPAEHLFKMLEIKPEKEKEIFSCGEGTVGVWKENPARITYSKENADLFRSFVNEVLCEKGLVEEYKNYLLLERAPYTVAAVMDESINDELLKLKGLFADMYSPDFEILTEKEVKPGENTLLCNIDQIEQPLAIVGTSVRVYSMEEENGVIYLTVAGSGDFRANIRIKVPFEVKTAEIDNENCECVYDALTKTVLVSFDSKTGERKIVLKGKD